MNLQLLLLSFLILISTNLISQSLEENYISFSENNESKNILNFENGGIATLTEQIAHSGSFYELRGSYTRKQDSIIIKFFTLKSKYETEIDSVNRKAFINDKIILIKNKTELIDYENKTVYVNSKLSKKMGLNEKFILFIDGEKFKMRNNKSFLRKLIDFVFGNERRLKKALEPVARNSSSYEHKKITGLEAYLQYGIKGLGGVITFESKE